MSIQNTATRVLADHQWHTIQELYLACQRFIAPERALRRYRFQSGEPPEIDIGVRAGKWRIMQDCMAKFKYDGGLIEARGYGMTREYRMAGDCIVRKAPQRKKEARSSNGRQ